MINIKEAAVSRAEWNNIVSGFHDLSLLQTWEYGEAKTITGSGCTKRFLFLGTDNEVQGACQCIVRKLPIINRGVVWINRGPLWRKEQNNSTAKLIEMLKQLKHYWVTERNMYLLIAPLVTVDEIEKNVIIDNGFSLLHPYAYWASARLDLSQHLETLRNNLNQKWRNCLNKAERLGIECQSGVGLNVFNIVLDQYDKMLKDKNLKGPAAPSFLNLLQNELDDNQKMFGLIARRGKDFLGGILVARYGTVCEYLVGTFNDNGKKANVGNYTLAGN